MLSKTTLAIVVALTVLPHSTFALTTSLPKANIERACRDAQQAALPESRSSAYKACIRDEHTAFEQLRQRWANYSAEARATCGGLGSEVSPSYVEMQTCLEMQPGGSFSMTPSRGRGGGRPLDLSLPTP